MSSWFCIQWNGMLGQKTKINIGFNQTVTKASWKKVFLISRSFSSCGEKYVLSKTANTYITKRQFNEYHCYRLVMYNFVN